MSNNPRASSCRDSDLGHVIGSYSNVGSTVTEQYPEALGDPARFESREAYLQEASHSQRMVVVWHKMKNEYVR